MGMRRIVSLSTTSTMSLPACAATVPNSSARSRRKHLQEVGVDRAHDRHPGRRAARGSRDTRNTVRWDVQPCPMACPTALEMPIAKPNLAGIIIRLSRCESLLRHRAKAPCSPNLGSCAPSGLPGFVRGDGGLRIVRRCRCCLDGAVVDARTIASSRCSNLRADQRPGLVGAGVPRRPLMGEVAVVMTRSGARQARAPSVVGCPHAAS